MRQQLTALYRALGDDRLIVASSGNVSARTAGGMLISPSGADVATIAAEQMVEMTLDGAAGGPLAPSSEWHMHAAIYRAFGDAQVIVHTHSDAATALACLDEKLPAFHYMLAEFGGDDVRCAPYVTFGTAELGRHAVEALRDRTACLLANHGMICHGSTPDAALHSAQRLETLCRQYLLARSVGTPRLLSGDEMAAAIERYRTYGQAKARPEANANQ